MTHIEQCLTRSEANEILSLLKAGLEVSPELVNRCLLITGDLIGAG